MKDSPRKIAREVDRLKEQRTDDTTDDAIAELAVRWRGADPEERPEGMVFDADAGTLAYDVWDAQRETLETLEAAEVDIAAMLGGYRSGKSTLGARWTVAKALEYPGTRWLVLGIDFSQASGTTFRTLFEALPGDRTHILTSAFNGPEESPIVADYNRQEHRLTLHNDAVITLGSADRWNRYVGDEYSGAWLDEPSHYGPDLFDILEVIGTRLTASAGPNLMCMTLTGNGYNSAWRVLEKQETPDGHPIGLDIEIAKASVLENPYLDDTDTDRIRRQFEGTKRAEQALHGGFAAAEGLVYNFDRETHIVDEETAEELLSDGETWLYGYDAGWRDPRTVIAVGVSPHEQLVVYDEFYERESHVDDAIRWLEGKPQGVIYAEHAPTDIDKLERAGWRVKEATKEIDAGIAEVRKRLTPDDDGRPGLVVSERCRNLIREFMSYKEEQVGTGAAMDHGLDALRYLCMGKTGSRGRGGAIDISDAFEVDTRRYRALRRL